MAFFTSGPLLKALGRADQAIFPMGRGGSRGREASRADRHNRDELGRSVDHRLVDKGVRDRRCVGGCASSFVRERNRVVAEVQLRPRRPILVDGSP